MIRILFLLCALITSQRLNAQTIAEKKSGGSVQAGTELTPDTKKLLVQVNKEMRESQEALHNLYDQIYELYRNNAPPEAYKELVDKVNREKENISALENSWKDIVLTSDKGDQYALWNQPETTIGQIVNDYGSHSFVYVSTPDISGIKINVDSNIPIPRASWNEILELLLAQNGIGIRQLNPYLRELYFINKDKSGVKVITNKRADLDIFPSDAKVAFVLSPEPAEVKRIWYFLDKFVNPNSTVLQMVGRDILIVGNVPEVQDLLKIYDFVSANKGDREYKAIPITKADVEEMAKILGAIFDTIVETPVPIERETEKSTEITTGPGGGTAITRQQRQRTEPIRPPSRPSQQPKEGGEANGLKIIALKHVGQALFLVGTKEEIRKAEEIIQQVEDQIGEARRKVIHWYVAKNSDPEELAQVLQKVYILMATTGTGTEIIEEALKAGAQLPQTKAREQELQFQREQLQYQANVGYQPAVIPRGITDTGFYLTDRFIVNPDPIKAPKPPPNQGRNNFLVDPKTSTIIMVVEADLLPKMKELIRKLDVPKKMVQIEVMLFEKRVNRDNNIGLNLLKIGTLASQTNATSLTFNAQTILQGITDFIISREKDCNNIPAYDATYRFLINRDDIFVKASPSILTMNQTKGTVEITTQISVNTGTFVIQSAGVPTLQESFARANYGIKIDVIPTIHMHDETSPLGDTTDYITLESELKFESIGVSLNNQPPVFTRVIRNIARIADGQTVILGGLRQVNKNDHREAIPYIGELPGFGKLFGRTQLHDEQVEMFVFMTPKIIAEPAIELERLRCEEMQRRPGDIPSYLCALEAAREKERNQLLAGTMTMLFGRRPERCVDTEKCAECTEYDGR